MAKVTIALKSVRQKMSRVEFTTDVSVYWVELGTRELNEDSTPRF